MVELKMLDFSDRTRTGISILTSAADKVRFSFKVIILKQEQNLLQAWGLFKFHGPLICLKVKIEDTRSYKFWRKKGYFSLNVYGTIQIWVDPTLESRYWEEPLGPNEVDLFWKPGPWIHIYFQSCN